MPLVDSNLQSTWEELDSYRAADGSVLRGYNRAGVVDHIGADADKLIDVLMTKGLVVGQRIAIIGGAFGWVGERLIARGFGPAADGTANGKVAIVDTSTWIHANVSGNANLVVVNADVNGATGRRTIRQQFGSNTAEVHWCLTEDVLPLLVGAGATPSGQNEIEPFTASCRQLMSVGTAHWISTGIRVWDNPAAWAGDPRLNWKTLEEWKNWVQNDFVIERQTGRVL